MSITVVNQAYKPKASKLPHAGTTIFTAMNQYAAEVGAGLNLAQGFPEWGPPAFLLEAYHNAGNADGQQYAPMTGLPALRAAIGEKVLRLYGVEVDKEREVLVTAGATQALFSTMHALIHAGDEVITLEPAYDCYGPAISLAGGVNVAVALPAPSFLPDWQVIEASITPKTTAILINTPHNPTGAVWGREDWLALEALAERHNLLVISDEVYEHMAFAPAVHYNALSFEGLRHRTVCVSSFGKTYHATGWKVGYIVAAESIMAEIRKVHQFEVFCVNRPVQAALAEALAREGEVQHEQSVGALYSEKLQTLLTALEAEGLSDAIETPAQGTYFQLINFAKINPKFGEMTDLEACQWLAREVGLVLIPLSAFYQNEPKTGFARICTAKSDATLEACAKALKLAGAVSPNKS